MALFGFVPFFLIKQCKMPADIFHLLVKKPFLLKEQLRTQMSTELEQRRGSYHVVKYVLMGD